MACHLKASVRESGRRELLIWCASGLPSKKNCATVSQGAGFIEPKFQPWTCEGKDGFHVWDLADWQHLCTHAWDGVMFLSGRTEGGTSRTCKRCGADAMVTHKKRAKHSTFLYNGHEVSEALYARITVAGPMPSTLDAEARAALISEMAKEPVTVDSRLALQGAVCGLCRYGEPDWDLIACTLGWEAHEALFYSAPSPAIGKETAWIAGSSHTGVPRPLLSPRCRCMALTDRWAPRRAA